NGGLRPPQARGLPEDLALAADVLVGSEPRAQDALRSVSVQSIIARLLRRDSSYEPEVQAAISKIVRPGWTCADVGAHPGIYTRLLAELVGSSGRVVAFEAHPANARRLRRSLGGLGGRVTVENVAVTDGAAARVTLHPGRRRASQEWNVMGVDLDGHRT